MCTRMRTRPAELVVLVSVHGLHLLAVARAALVRRAAAHLCGKRAEHAAEDRTTAAHRGRDGSLRLPAHGT